MNRRLATILLYAAMLMVIYAAATPPFESPDESSHFVYIHDLANTQRLPVIEAPQAMVESESLQRHHPPLYYIMGAILVAPVDRSDYQDYLVRNPVGSLGVVSENNQNIFLHPWRPNGAGAGLAIQILRLYSILLSLLTLYFIYQVALLVTASHSLSSTSTILVASLPTFLSIGSSINNDNLITLIFAATVYVSLRAYCIAKLRFRDIVLLGILLGGAALTKLTGLALFGVVFLVLLIGWWRGKWSVRRLFSSALMLAIIAAIISGWWYIRNLQLYGDLFALDATSEYWGREAPNDIDQIIFETKGIWTSLWFVLGQFNIFGNAYYYNFIYILTATALVGLAIAIWRRQYPIEYMLILLILCGGMVFTVFVATRRVNVSQGRLLFPALVAFAPLYVIGLRHFWGKMGRYWVLPFAAIALWAPVLHILPAFRPLHVVNAVAPQAAPIDVRSETLSFHGLLVEPNAIYAGEIINYNLYFSGNHPENPQLFIKALDPVTRSVLGEINVYPGMSPTSMLDRGRLFVAEDRFRLNAGARPACAPCRLELLMGWYIRERDDNVTMMDSVGNPTQFVLLPGPFFMQPSPETLNHHVDIPMGNVSLLGYEFETQPLAGSELVVRFQWRMADYSPLDWRLALGLLDENRRLVMRIDGLVSGYPAEAFEVSTIFNDVRRVPLAAELTSDEYILYVGRYDLGEAPVMVENGEMIGEAIFEIPINIMHP